MTTQRFRHTYISICHLDQKCYARAWKWNVLCPLPAKVAHNGSTMNKWDRRMELLCLLLGNIFTYGRLQYRSYIDLFRSICIYLERKADCIWFVFNENITIIVLKKVGRAYNNFTYFEIVENCWKLICTLAIMNLNTHTAGWLPSTLSKYYKYVEYSTS